MIETVVRLPGENLHQQRGRGGVEGGVVNTCPPRMRGNLGLQFGQAERDRFLDLLGEVKVLAGGVRKERVDEMQPAQVVAGAKHWDQGPGTRDGTKRGRIKSRVPGPWSLVFGPSCPRR